MVRSKNQSSAPSQLKTKTQKEIKKPQKTSQIKKQFITE